MQVVAVFAGGLDALQFCKISRKDFFFIETNLAYILLADILFSFMDELCHLRHFKCFFFFPLNFVVTPLLRLCYFFQLQNVIEI